MQTLLSTISYRIDPRGYFFTTTFGKLGGLAIFYIDSGKELEALQEKDEMLKEWESQIFPLTFTELPIEFLYQTDFTMGVYRGKRLRELYAEYSGSEYSKNVDARA